MADAEKGQHSTASGSESAAGDELFWCSYCDMILGDCTCDWLSRQIRSRAIPNDAALMGQRWRVFNLTGGFALGYA
jgi:hypothetical protein